MFKPLSLFLGMRYVRSRHGNGFSSFISASSTIGISLGVMVLILVLSAMNGFERELAQRLLSIVPHAELISVNEPLSDWRNSIKKVQKHPSVLAAAPVIKMTAMMQHKSSLKALEIRGVDAKLEKQASAITDYIIAGDWQRLAPTKAGESDNGIVIGAGIAGKLGVKVGDNVQILLAQPADNAIKQNSKRFPVPIKRNVTVVAIFKFGGTIDDSLAYVSLSQAQNIMQLGEHQAQGVRLKVADVFSAPFIAKEIAYNFDHYVYIYDWTRSQGHLYADIQMVRMVMFIVLTLVIAVASFNIVSTLIMAVNDKKSDIAILKTMGASRTTIMTTFMIQGVVNGIVGSLTGALLGVYLSLNLSTMVAAIESFLSVKFLSADVYFIDFLPTELHQSDVVFIVITALILSLLATIYPAWRATKVDPAEVLGQV
jgi:lipoprotein-releasing system permease protein